MPESRGRKKKTPKRGRTPPVRQRLPGDPLRQQMQRIGREAHDRLLNLLSNRPVPGEVLVPMIVPLVWLWRAADARVPANVCLDACQIMRHAYAQFGIRAELHAVDLVVKHPQRGTVFYATPEPTWDGKELDGHCVLWLPDSGRIVDPTVAQYPEVAALRLGPIVGRIQAVQGTHGAIEAITGGGTLPDNCHFGVPLGEALLMYTTATRAATQVITGSPWARDNAEGHHRAGSNLALSVLELIRGAGIDLARLTSFPRLIALLRAIGNAQADYSDPQRWYFRFDGPAGTAGDLQAVDQIALPSGTPPAISV